MSNPKISVLMPAYNAEKYLCDAIQSVLNQTYRNFELLIINDGSTDNTAEIIRSFSDTRIRYIENPTNTGLGNVRNQALKESKGEYIAWLDADDVAHKNRLDEQCRFLDSHPDFAMTGTWVSLIDPNGNKTGVSWKENSLSEELPILMMFNNRFAQPSVIIRKSILSKNPYRQEFAPAEDYDLWVRIASKGRVWNIPKVLLLYRKHGQNISQTKATEKDDAVRKIITGQLAKLGINPSETEYKIHRTNFIANYENMDEFFNLRESWLLKLMEANDKTGIYDKELFASVMAKIWLTSCQSNIKKYPRVWKRFNDSPLANYLGWRKNWRELLKFKLKSAIRN